MSSSLQTKLLLASFLTLYIITIVSIMGIALYSGVYTYATEGKTIPAVDFISISTNKDNFIIKYKNQKGKSKKLRLSDNYKIIYKTSNISKIEYEEKTEYNIFKKEINKEVTKITIYKEEAYENYFFLIMDIVLFIINIHNYKFFKEREDKTGLKICIAAIFLLLFCIFYYTYVIFL